MDEVMGWWWRTMGSPLSGEVEMGSDRGQSKLISEVRRRCEDCPRMLYPRRWRCRGRRCQRKRGANAPWDATATGWLMSATVHRLCLIQNDEKN